MWHFVKVLAPCTVGAVLSGCGSAGTLGHPSTGATRTQGAHNLRSNLNLPQHVIVIVQENRSFDNLFQGFPGADTQSFGYNTLGVQVPLTQLPLGTQYDPSHSHTAFSTEFRGGAMNGFNKEQCNGCPKNIAYTFVNPTDIAPYTQLATQYALADHVLQPNEGPSFPGHIYLIAGQTGSPGSHWYVSENPLPRKQKPSNCLASANHTVQQIDMTTPYPGVEGNPIFPCIDPPTILDELDKASIEWRYYTPSLGSIWTAPLAVNHLFNSPADKARVITPETTILSDIRSNNLQPVSYVIPSRQNSDHAGPSKPTGGPAWVASIVNAVGASPYWQNTAIIVTWDDWGGWYDHYTPTHPTNPFGGNPDPYEYGFRVPLLAIGSTAQSGLVDHTPRSSAAILHFIEDVFGLPSLGTLDAQTDDLFDMFNFGQTRRTFKKIPTGSVTVEGLRRQAPDQTPVDDD
jgi:phospholipase C